MFSELSSIQTSVLFLWYFVCIGAFVYCSYTDLRTRRIPNRITYPLLLSTLLIMIVYGVFSQALLGGLIAGAILLVPRILGGRAKAGMGDVKLSALGGLLVGPGYALIALFVAFFSAFLSLVPFVLLKRLKWTQTIAFGPYLSFGFIVVIAAFIWPEFLSQYAPLVEEVVQTLHHLISVS